MTAGSAVVAVFCGVLLAYAAGGISRARTAEEQWSRFALSLWLMAFVLFESLVQPSGVR